MAIQSTDKIIKFLTIVYLFYSCSNKNTFKGLKQIQYEKPKIKTDCVICPKSSNNNNLKTKKNEKNFRKNRK